MNEPDMDEQLQMRVTVAYERRKLISLLEEYSDEKLKNLNDECCTWEHFDPDEYTWEQLKSHLDLIDETGTGSNSFESFLESLKSNGDRLVAFEKLLPMDDHMSPVYSILRIAVHVLQSSGEQIKHVEKSFLVPLGEIMEQVYLVSRTAEAAEGLECRAEVPIQSKIIEFYGAVVRACTDIFSSFLKHSRGDSCTCHVDSADQAPLASVQEVKQCQEAITTEILGCLHRQSSMIGHGARRISLFTIDGPVALSEDCADAHDDKRTRSQQGAEEQSTDTNGYDAALHAESEKIYSAFYTLFQAHPDVDGLLDLITNESEGSASGGTGTTFTETLSTVDNIEYDCPLGDQEPGSDSSPEDMDYYRAANDHAGLHSDQSMPANYYEHQQPRFPYSRRRDYVDLDIIPEPVFGAPYPATISRDTCTGVTYSLQNGRLRGPDRRTKYGFSPPPRRSSVPGEPVSDPTDRPCLPFSSTDSHPLSAHVRESLVPTRNGFRGLGLNRLTKGLQRGLRNATSFPVQDQHVLSALRIKSTLALLDYAPDIPESNIIAMIKHQDTFGEYEEETFTFVRRSEKLRTWMVECKSSRALLINGQFPAADATTAISPLSVLCAQIAHMYSAVMASTVVLSYFCGVRTREDPASAGPRDMMRSLLSQLLAVYAEHQFEFEGSLDKEKLENRIAVGQLTPLCAVFDALVLQLPRNTVVYCIVDSISVFENRKHGAALERCLNRFFKLVGNKKSGVIFKLFVTAPGDSSCKPKGQAEVLNVLEESQDGRYGEFAWRCLSQVRY